LKAHSWSNLEPRERIKRLREELTSRSGASRAADAAAKIN
jgi:hypothetical protein